VRRRVSALSDAVDRVAIEGAEAVDHRAEHSAVDELLGWPRLALVSQEPSEGNPVGLRAAF
jgi:hypothetical protein